MNSVIYIVGYALVLWDFPKIGVPLIIQFNRISHYKPSILRYLHLWKPPYMAYSSILTCPCTVEWPHCDRTLEWWLFFGRGIPKISLFLYIYTHTFFSIDLYIYIYFPYMFHRFSPGSIHPHSTTPGQVHALETRTTHRTQGRAGLRLGPGTNMVI